MMMTHAQSPDQSRVSSDWKDAVLHARISIGDTLRLLSRLFHLGRSCATSMTQVVIPSYGFGLHEPAERTVWVGGRFSLFLTTPSDQFQ